MNIVEHIIVSIIAILFAQIVAHLTKKILPIVKEEITYKEFWHSLKKDFRFDIKYTLIYLLLFNLIIYFTESNFTEYLYMIVIFALTLVFSIDYRFQLIPDEAHLIIVIAAIINIFANLSNWWNYVFGAIIGAAIFYGLGILSKWIFKKEGMGFGDVKLMAALGLMFGIKQILVITLISFIFGAIIGGIILIFKNKKSDGYIAFGPFIVIAVLIIMFVPAEYIIELYISFCTWLGMQMSDFIYFVSKKLNFIK